MHAPGKIAAILGRTRPYRRDWPNPAHKFLFHVAYVAQMLARRARLSHSSTNR
jgi:hypothetical protein